MLIGIIGKPNVGKSTFFNAATDFSVPTANYPFTTIKPNIGLAHIRVKCVCKEFDITDSPVHSVCVYGNRFIPVNLIDVAGLVPGAHIGKGLGNKFLDEARQADALIHVIDASGSTDPEGKAISPGTGDPLLDIESVEKEIDLWLASIVAKDWSKIQRESENQSQKTEEILATRLSGFGVTVAQIRSIMNRFNLFSKNLDLWNESDIINFSKAIRIHTKPIVIAANKVDSETAADNLDKIKRNKRDAIPCVAEAEVLLRRASNKGILDYLPGDNDFKIKDILHLTDRQRRALIKIRSLIQRYGSTGIQRTINVATLELLKLIVVYPVEDELKLTDKKGNVLPDARLIPYGSTIRDLAGKIHTDLSKGLLYGIDVRSNMRLGRDHILKNNDVIKIVSTTSKG